MLASVPKDEQGERLLLGIHVESIHAMVVRAEGDLLYGFLAWHMQFLFEVQQAEVVALETAMFAAEFFVRAGQFRGCDRHCKGGFGRRLWGRIRR